MDWMVPLWSIRSVGLRNVRVEMLSCERERERAREKERMRRREREGKEERAREREEG